MFQYKKSWIFFLFLILFNPVASWLAKNIYGNDLQKIIDLIKRRNTLVSDEDVIGIPDIVEELPEAEPIHPGHTLLQPSFGMLKSSVKYPHKDVGGTAVYGNLNNLGMTYGKSNERVLYTGFRKANEILTKLLQVLDKKSKNNPMKSTNDLVVLKLVPSIKHEGNRNSDFQVINNNNAMEILDEPNASNEESNYQQTRRQRKPRYSKYRDRDSTQSSSDESDSSSSNESSDYEQNPGNPYTVHKDKYKQNWLWNHFMDGNHMNVNPYAPPFNSMGPSGAALFFGRKWWYFNQDDFKPLN